MVLSSSKSTSTSHNNQNDDYYMNRNVNSLEGSESVLPMRTNNRGLHHRNGTSSHSNSNDQSKKTFFRKPLHHLRNSKVTFSSSTMPSTSKSISKISISTSTTTKKYFKKCSIFSIFKIGIFIFVFLYLVLIYHVGNIFHNYQYDDGSTITGTVTGTHSHFRHNPFHPFDALSSAFTESTTTNVTANTSTATATSTSSHNTQQRAYDYNHQNHNHNPVLYSSTNPMSPPSTPQHILPKDSEATQRTIQWKMEERRKFNQEYTLRQARRKERIQKQSIINHDGEDLHEIRKEYSDLFHFDFLYEDQNQDDNDATNTKATTTTISHNDDVKLKTPCSVITQNAAEANPSFYPDRHTIDSDSTILITGILNRVGFHLALKLVTECNVKIMIGVDPLIPNTKINRIHALKQISILYQNIPKFQRPLIMTYAGLNPKNVYHLNHVDYMSNDTGEIDYSKWNPTHVIHVISNYDYDGYESLLDDDADNDNDNTRSKDKDFTLEDDGNTPIFGLRQSLTGIDQLLSTLSKNSESTFHFTLISDFNILSDSLVDNTAASLEKSKGQDSMIDNNREGRIVADEYSKFHIVTKLMEEVLLQFYARNELSNHNNTFVTLRLPFVYGPWGKQGSIDYELAEKAVKHWNDEVKMKRTSDKDESVLLSMVKGQKHWNHNVERDVLFVDDAVNTIITAMQYRKEDGSPSSFNIISGEKASASTLADLIELFMQMPNHPSIKHSNMTIYDENGTLLLLPSVSHLAREHLNFSPKISLRTGVAQLLAWHLNEHRGQMAWKDYDNSIQESTKSLPRDFQEEQKLSTEATETGYEFLKREMLSICDDITDPSCTRGDHILPCASECSDTSMCKPTPLDEASTLSNKATEDCDKVIYTTAFGSDISTIDVKAPDDNKGEICAIAFVSENSHLVEDLRNKGGNFGDVNIFGIILSYKGWKLIPVNIEDRSLRPDEEWLPKLSPGKLFHPSVRIAIYLYNKFPMNPSLNDMLFISSLMTWEKQDKLGNVLDSKKSTLLVTELDRKISKSGEGQVASTLSDSEVKEKILEERGISNKQALQKHFVHYQKASMLLNRCEFSLECSYTLKYKLRDWVKTNWVVHDLHIPRGKNFRCDWYKEHIQWDDDFDAISFAHVMALKKVEQFVLLEDKDLKEEILEKEARGEVESTWFSFGDEYQDTNDVEYLQIVDAEAMVRRRRYWNDALTQ